MSINSIKYGYKKRVDLNFKDAVNKVKNELKKQGFGVLVEIDVKKTLKEKIGVEFNEYIILGACNPKNAHKALMSEIEIGLMLPCNIIIYKKDGKIFVSTILPYSIMGIIGNKNLNNIAKEVEKKLKKVIDNI